MIKGLFTKFVLIHRRIGQFPGARSSKASLLPLGMKGLPNDLSLSKAREQKAIDTVHISQPPRAENSREMRREWI